MVGEIESVVSSANSRPQPVLPIVDDLPKEETLSIEWHKSTCPYCGIGCGLMVGVESGSIVEIRGMEGHPANDGDLCALSTNLPGVFAAQGRLTQPLIRRAGALVPVEWDTAISHVADGLRRTIDEYGPGAVAFYGGAANLTEEYYLMNKLMKNNSMMNY